MIRINLLPHREEKRKARRQQFYALSGLVSILAGLIIVLVWSIINAQINAQLETNAFLKKENDSLDKQIAQIKSLKDEINILLEKKKVIENLQKDRGRAVSLFNEIAKQIPDGVYLKSLRQNGLQLTLAGVSQSNSRVSDLMRNLEQSPAFERPRLVETRSLVVDRKRMQEFNMLLAMTPVPAEEAKGIVPKSGGKGK